MKGKVIKNIITTVGLPVLFGALIFTLWQTKVLHTLFGTDEIILPLPTRIGSIIGDNFTNMLPQIASTLIVALGGLVLGSILGYFIGVAGAVFKKWGMGGLTIVSAFNAIPLVALAPVINNWTRDLSGVVDIRSMVAKIITVTIFCTASMSVNAYRGLTEVKPFSEDLFASYGSGKLKIFFKLRLPNSLPYVFTALRVSVPSCIIGAVVSEYFAEQVIGVGRQIRENIVKGQFPTAWAYITIACVMGILMYIILLTVEAIVLKNRRAR